MCFPDENTIESLSGLLTPCVAAELKHNGKRKSITLFGVTIVFRKQPEKVDIIDGESALSYCEAHHPESVIVKKELSKTELKKLCGKRIYGLHIILSFRAAWDYLVFTFINCQGKIKVLGLSE